MKKILFFAFGLSALLFNAQTLTSGDLNNLTLGDAGSNFTFSEMGQDNFYLNNGSAPDYQIVQIDATHGKSFQIKSGLGGTTASIRQVAKASLQTPWGTRTTGNNIVIGKVSIYTGTPTGTASEDQFRSNISGRMAGGTTPGTLAGVYYNYKDGKIYGHASMKNGASYGLYYFTLGNSSFPANTWINLSYYYNADTGQVNWVTPDGNYFGNNAAYVVTSSYPTQFNIAYVPTQSTSLTNSYVSAFDNYSVEATNEATLGVGIPVGDKNIVLKIYPNPVANYLNVESKNKLQSVELFDMSGKRVLVVSDKSSKIDLQSLKKGLYMVKINTENGTFTEKIIKE